MLKTSRSRIRSASAGRDRKSGMIYQHKFSFCICVELSIMRFLLFTDLQARYWGLLFENLRRAVDEIYLTCESDESVEECKEAIMILESCTKDLNGSDLNGIMSRHLPHNDRPLLLGKLENLLLQRYECLFNKIKKFYSRKL